MLTALSCLLGGGLMYLGARHAIVVLALPALRARALSAPSPAGGAGQQPALATVDAARASAVRLEPSAPRFVLGSKSATRRAILAATGATFDVIVPDIDEKAIGDRSVDPPHVLVRQIAEAKADALLSRLAADSTNAAAATGTEEAEGKPCAEMRVLLTGDQVVTYEGHIREKPSSISQAREFIESYSRAPCGTVQAICLHDLRTGRRAVGVDVASIEFGQIPEGVVRTLLADEAVLHCAGGLMVEHPAVAPHLRAIVGGVDSVMGLSTRLLRSLLRELRHPVGTAAEATGGLTAAPPGLPSVAAGPTMHELVLAQREWAVVGDVGNPAKPAHAIVARLRAAGRAVVQVDPRCADDGPAELFRSLTEAGGSERISAVDLVISPRLGLRVVEEMWALGIRYLFVQPGADSERVLARARELGLVVTTGCVLREEM